MNPFQRNLSHLLVQLEWADIEELLQQFAKVRPICTYYTENGKHPKTSHPKLVKKIGQ